MINNQVFENYLNKEVINKALITLVIIRNVAFHLVEWPEFHIVYQALNLKADTVIPKAHTTIRYKVIQAFQDYKDIV
jgi:hypothetical protein